MTSFEKQAQEQKGLLKVAEKKRLEGKQEELEKAKQLAYDLGKKETF